MKILIGYDGSKCSDDAIDDLTRAGLPQDVEALVLTAADVWPAVGAMTSSTVMPGEALAATVGPLAAQTDAFAKRAVKEAKIIALSGAELLRERLPGWKITPEISTDSPNSALLLRADAWGADLIVVGSHGHSALGQVFLGSTALAVLHHAKCSVRISRARPESKEKRIDPREPVRIVLGIDASPGSDAAARAIEHRTWPPETEIRVIGAIDVTSLSLGLGMNCEWSPAAFDALREHGVHLQEAAQRHAKHLRECGLGATPVLREGNPKHILLNEAEGWNADCIFVGARGLSRLERVVLGSVSATVAARAHCSVEVVRS